MNKETRSAAVTTAGASRDAFTSSFGVLAATLGSAVGLGNIWKFPYVTGANGGASFLVVYVLATLLVGLPVMIAEIMLGRKAKADAVTTLRTLAPAGQPWWLIGAFGVPRQDFIDESATPELAGSVPQVFDAHADAVPGASDWFGSGPTLEKT